MLSITTFLPSYVKNKVLRVGVKLFSQFRKANKEGNDGREVGREEGMKVMTASNTYDIQQATSVYVNTYQETLRLYKKKGRKEGRYARISYLWKADQWREIDIFQLCARCPDLFLCRDSCQNV